MAGSFRNSSPSRASAATDTLSEASRIPPVYAGGRAACSGPPSHLTAPPRPAPGLFSLSWLGLDPARADRPPRDTFFDALNARADWKP